MERLLNVAEAAEILRVPKSWIYERTRNDSIPFIRLGKYVRFTEKMLEGIIQEATREVRL